MTKKLKIAAWLGIGAVALAIGASAAPTRSAADARSEPPPEDQGRICVAERAGAAGPVSWHPATLAVVLGSTPDAATLLADLEDQLDYAEESSNPMALDLDPADASKQKRLRAELWPRVTAAQTLFLPELVRCSDAAARYSLWREHAALPPAPPQLRQRAWATATLAVVRSGEGPRLAARLRARSAEPGSAIALVIEPLARVDGLSRLGERAKKLAERARRAGRTAPPLLALLAAASDASDVPIALGAGDLAVVPRLGSLARLPEFTAEIERALDSGDRFVHWPEPIVSDSNSGAGG